MPMGGNESTREAPKRAWATVAMLWFVACFFYITRIMLTTMRGSVVGAIPMSDAQFGLLTSAFLWPYGLLSPLAGFLSDRLSRSRVIVLSMFAWSAITWITSYAKTFEQLLAMRVLTGVSEACYLPASLALIADYHRGPTRSFATGLYLTGVTTGGALGGLVGWMAQQHSWSYAFRFIGGTGVIYSALLILVLRDSPREFSEPGAAPKARFKVAVASLLDSGSFMLLLSSCALVGIVGWAVAGWMPTYMQEHFHLGQGAAGLSSVSYLNLTGSLGLLVGGVWADRWGRRHRRGYIFVAAIGLVLAAPSLLLVEKADILAMAMLGLTLFGLGTGFSDCNTMPILCQVVDPRYRATGYGMINFVATIAGGLAIYAVGALRDLQFETGRILGFAAVGLALCAGLLLLLRPRRL
jgi:MFS family permease